MTQTLKDKLAGKTILVVDDQPYTVRDYLYRFRDAGVAYENVETMDTAFERLKQNPDRYGIALLDLNMPEATTPALLAHDPALGLKPTSFNHGRRLGLYLWAQREALKLPYCYLSALSHVYGQTLGEFAGQESDFILDKAAVLASELQDRLVQVLDKWAMLPAPGAQS